MAKTNAAMHGIKAILNKGVTAKINDKMEAIKPNTKKNVFITFNFLNLLPI